MERAKIASELTERQGSVVATFVGVVVSLLFHIGLIFLFLYVFFNFFIRFCFVSQSSRTELGACKDSSRTD